MLVALGTQEEARTNFQPQFLCNFLATVLLLSGHRNNLTSKSAVFSCFFYTCPGPLMAQEPGRILLSLSALHPVYS